MPPQSFKAREQAVTDELLNAVAAAAESYQDRAAADPAGGWHLSVTYDPTYAGAENDAVLMAKAAAAVISEQQEDLDDALNSLAEASDAAKKAADQAERELLSECLVC